MTAAPARPRASIPENVHLALLRGLNVGGKNKLPMQELGALFTEAGGLDVQTYIQSGNVVFRATASAAARVGLLVAQALAARFGHPIPVGLRSGAELAAVARHNPFLPRAEASALHVMFLDRAPSAAQTSGLDPARSPQDAFEVVGREIYLHCPNGFGNTKLTNAYFDSRLATTSTCRNWRTVLALCELCAAAR